MSRLPPPLGTRLDRSRPFTFTFEGARIEAFPGDTIASALAAADRMMLSRSFKYHRPRGGFAFAGEAANTLVQVGAEPNVQADLRAAEPGMVVTAQNVTGTLARDRDAVLDRLSRFLPVGFYYRTFIGPGRRAWLKVWEPRNPRQGGPRPARPAGR